MTKCEAIEIALTNAEMAADQVIEHETIEAAFWAYRTNVEDSLSNPKLHGPAFDAFDARFEALTGRNPADHR